MQQPTDQSVGQYLNTALVAGQYKIYCPAMAFDLPVQSVTFLCTLSISHYSMLHSFTSFDP